MPHLAPVLALLLAVPAAQAAVSTFDDLPLTPESFFDPNETTTFESGAARFQHNTPFGACCWDGFTYSNRTDTTTPGFGNQYSAIPGQGVNGSSNYAVAYDPGSPPRVEFSSVQSVRGAYFTNTTYAFLAMRDGDDGVSPPFVSGPFGEEDFFRVTVTGLNAAGEEVGTDDFLLADGTSIIDSWVWVDLTTLGPVAALEFSLASSDVSGDFINTPTYFAMDDLTTVPLPPAVWLLGTALVAVMGLGRRTFVKQRS